jgi:hypothetical protein
MKRPKKFKRWLVADCETDSFDGQAVQPFLWALITSEGDRLLTYSTAEFVDYIRAFDGVAYCHNGGKFDWLMPGVVGNIEHGEIMLINARLARAKIGLCEIRDSWLIIPTALSSGGDKMDFDYTVLDRATPGKRRDHAQLIERYIMQDCIALFNMVERFRARHGDALTQAGAALSTWEDMGGYKRRYGFGHDAFFRPWYFGGRCEAFKIGAPLPGRFQYFDIVSSYPAAMCALHPAGTDYKGSTDYLNAPGGSFWTVTALSRGAFPLRDDNGLWFPHDDIIREYRITGWELHAALETNTAEIVAASGYVPIQTETLKPYIDQFFAEKLEAEKTGDTIGRLLAKLFLNSLYGKFSSNPSNYKDYQMIAPGAITNQHKREGWQPDLEGDGYDIISRPSRQAQYFDVALGASITGYARAALWRGICASSGVVYCDTDSIMCEKFGGSSSGELGGWKSEGELERLHIGGKKLYAGLLVKDGKGKVLKADCQVWKSAHKGFSKLDTDVKDIIRAARGEVVYIKKSAPSITILGEQKFIARRMRITTRGDKPLKSVKVVMAEKARLQNKVAKGAKSA